jgi:hypothetical protein
MLASMVALGRLDDVAEARARVLALEPNSTLAALAARTPLPASVRDLFVARLRQGGLPE